MRTSALNRPPRDSEHAVLPESNEDRPRCNESSVADHDPFLPVRQRGAKDSRSGRLRPINRRRRPRGQSAYSTNFGPRRNDVGFPLPRSDHPVDLTTDRERVASRIWVQPPILGNRSTGRSNLAVPRPSRPPTG
jgi:hypothetical protein